jgi:hypothetical protein
LATDQVTGVQPERRYGERFLIQPFQPRGDPFLICAIFLERQPVWIRPVERPPTKRVSLGRLAERADVVVNHPLEGRPGEFLFAKLLPTCSEFPAIRSVAQQSLVQMI